MKIVQLLQKTVHKVKKMAYSQMTNNHLIISVLLWVKCFSLCLILIAYEWKLLLFISKLLNIGLLFSVHFLPDTGSIFLVSDNGLRFTFVECKTSNVIMLQNTCTMHYPDDKWPCVI